MIPRKEYPVLVAEAHTMGSLAVIRSLGRAGYPVHACSSRPDAVGFWSNYSCARAAHPDYEKAEFADWLRLYIRKHQIRAIIPSEGMLLALRPRFNEYADLFPLTQQPELVYRVMSKSDVFECLTRVATSDSVSDHIPPSMVVDCPDHLPNKSEIENLGPEHYLKVDSCYAKDGQDSAVYHTNSANETYDKLKGLAPNFRKVLIQRHVPGQGVGVFFLWWKGHLLAEFMHRRLHEVPHTGGQSSLRESWWHSAIRNDALAKLSYLGWEGVAMMEYRWDPASAQFYFIELNARFWGSLHLALHAGVDFPVLLIDTFQGRSRACVNRFTLGVRCRHTFPMEVQYVWSRLRDRQLRVRSRVWSLFEFLLLSLDPRVFSDLSFRGDRELYWRGVVQFMRSVLPRVRLEHLHTQLKMTLLLVSKCLGLFHAARYLTRGGVRILCYHGFSLDGESAFRPKLFIEPTTFYKRLTFLSEEHFSVIELNRAVDGLAQSNLPAGAVVVTIDDGFYSFYRLAFPMLRKFGFPATLYVTSYYSLKGNPVFRLAVQYMFWKTREQRLDCVGLGPRWSDASIRTDSEKQNIMWDIIDYGEKNCDEPGRSRLAELLGKRLRVDYRAVESSRCLNLVSASEIRDMVSGGISIQLHSHRHHLPLDKAAAFREICDNKDYLEHLVSEPLRHFCYPSGEWSEVQLPWLEGMGIKSATTCDPGLNFPGGATFTLKRFLDGENVSQLEFEAEMFGYTELLRSGRKAISRLVRMFKRCFHVRGQYADSGNVG
jgi:peptidoglycan/xylan/chitin deacetylase (PgdA/CDA1 family)